MSALQYLIDCEDSSFCVIHGESFRNDNTNSILSVGSKVCFAWPEGKPKKKQKLWNGTIFEMSDDEKYLLDLMKTESEKRIAENRRLIADKRRKENDHQPTNKSKSDRKLYEKKKSFDLKKNKREKNRQHSVQDQEILDKLQAIAIAKRSAIEEGGRVPDISSYELNEVNFKDKVRKMIDDIDRKIEHIQKLVKMLKKFKQRVESTYIKLTSSDKKILSRTSRRPSHVDSTRSSEYLNNPGSTSIIPVNDKDGSWTLMCSGPDSGKNQELIQGSGVFVNKYDLGAVLADPDVNTQSQLARRLFELLFNEKALQICSLTGRPAPGGQSSNAEKQPVRPGLHKGARKALLCYARIHAKESKWKVIDNTRINTSLRNKLGEIRDTIKENNISD